MYNGNTKESPFLKWPSILFLTAVWAAFFLLVPARLSAEDPGEDKGHTAGRQTPGEFRQKLAASELNEEQLLLLARRLIQKGRYDQALDALEFYFAGDDRSEKMDFEAGALAETARELLAPGSGPQKSSGPGRAGHLPRIRGVQIFVFNSPNMSDVRQELSSLVKRGIDTIIVRVFHNAGDRPLIKNVAAGEPGVYFATDEAPVTADLLGEIVRIAHEFNLKVFAWMTTRRSDWLIHRRPDWLEHRYDFALGRSLPSRGLSVFQGGVRKKLRRIMEDLARTGVDGLLFQDDMIMRHNEGFSSLAKQLFLMDTGLGIHPDDLYIIPAPGRKPSGYRPLFWKWCRWKVSSLLSFLDEIVSGALEINPSLLVAANVYYESILAPENALAWYAQDVNGLLEHGVDYLALMSYHRQMKSELSLNDAQLEALFDQFISRAKDLAIDEARIIFKIQTLDWETSRIIPAAERETLLQLILEKGFFSTALLQNRNY